MSSTSGIWLGRHRELAELEGGLDALAAGRGGLYLVVGEPGIGKTRLCDELVRSAAARGIAVHWGRAWEAGGAPSYWPFIQVLRSIGDASVIERAATTERFELFDAVSASLTAAAARSPLVVVLDDLHAADPSSIHMLHFLVRDLRSRPLMIVGTYREAEARLVLEIGRTLAQVAREAVVLPLRRLDRREVGEYLARATGEASDDRVDALFRRTEGNPLFLRELMQLGSQTTRAPDGIREVVRQRLGLLAPELRATLEIASVLGRELSLDVLAAIAEMTEGDVLAQFSPATDLGIVEPLDGGRWRFTHVLLREGLYEELDRTRRTVLHRQVASELRARDGDASEIAHHLLLAIPAAPLGEAVDAALRAAERSMQLLAFEDAEVALARVVKPLQAAPDETRRLFEVMLAMGIAQIRALDPEAGSATCMRAVDIARRLADGELFARAVLGSASEFDPGIRNVALIGLLEEALARLPPGDGALRARCTAQLAAERQPEPDAEPPIQLARDAVAMARRLGDVEALRYTLAAAVLAMMGVGDSYERFALSSECLELALRANDKVHAMRMHLFVALGQWGRGDITSAETHVHQYAALAGTRRTNRVCFIESNMLAAAALWRGNIREAKRLYEECEQIATHDPPARDGVGALAFELGLRRVTEDFADLPALEVDLRKKIGAVYGDLGGCLAEMIICQLYASAGDRDRAADQLASVRAHPVFPQIREPAWLALTVDAIELVGDADMAALLYPTLVARAKHFYSLGPLGTYAEPPYARQLGKLARVLGRLDDATTHLSEAEAGCVGAGMRSHLARVRYELARVLLARGETERAKTLLANARKIAEELQQNTTLALIDALGTPEPASDLAFTLVREGDIWTIACGGKTLRLKDLRGLHVLHELVSRPNHELHVLQLISSDEPVDRGDAGVMLDTKAIATYRTRLLDLREELEEAEQFSDRGRSERAKEEIEMLTQELARAVGLGGRSRRVGGAAERARTTIQKRVREAIRRIEEGIPDLGRHLEHSIFTGAFCGYFPQGRPRTKRRLL